MERREPSYTVGRNVSWYSHDGKQYGKKLIAEFPYDPAIPLLGIYPEKTNSRRYKHSRVQSSLIYNSQDVKTTSVSINR